jgi:hypothetical protein
MEDKQILARQEKGVPLGPVTSLLSFLAYQQGPTLWLLWSFEPQCGEDGTLVDRDSSEQDK